MGLNQIHLVLSTRQLTSVTTQFFAESLKHLPDQEELHRAFQEKNDLLKLRRINELFEKRDWPSPYSHSVNPVRPGFDRVEIKFVGEPSAGE